MKEFTRLTTSEPVVTVTVCAPSAVVGAMLITAVAVVTDVTVTEITVTPAPNVATVDPCTKCVY